MSIEYKIDSKGLEEAIRRSPRKVKEEVGKFLVRGLAEYRRHIAGSPWRVGSRGGGSPVAAEHGGHLRDTHWSDIRPFEGVIMPTAKYAGFVHEGTRYLRKRPWLDYAKKAGETRIKQLQRELLQTITQDLAR